MQKRKIMFFHIGYANGVDYNGIVFDNKSGKNIKKQEKDTSQLGFNFKFKNLLMSQVREFIKFILTSLKNKNNSYISYERRNLL